MFMLTGHIVQKYLQQETFTHFLKYLVACSETNLRNDCANYNYIFHVKSYLEKCFVFLQL